MTTERFRIEVSGIEIDVQRKPIKNLHLGVYPPEGRVRVAAPTQLNDDAIRRAVVSRLSWIRRRRALFAEQDRQAPRQMVTGEDHYFRGRRYRLDVVQRPGAARVRIANNTTMELAVPPHMDTAGRARAQERWYRRRFQELLPALVGQWALHVGVTVNECRIKRMKTRWGSCNREAGRIWLNLELIKKPPRCLDYILVHELVHLHERHHNERFCCLMDRYLPDWRLRRDLLNSAPLAHEHWQY